MKTCFQLFSSLLLNISLKIYIMFKIDTVFANVYNIINSIYK